MVSAVFDIALIVIACSMSFNQPENVCMKYCGGIKQ